MPNQAPTAALPQNGREWEEMRGDLKFSRRRSSFACRRESKAQAAPTTGGCSSAGRLKPSAPFSAVFSHFAANHERARYGRWAISAPHAAQLGNGPKCLNMSQDFCIPALAAPRRSATPRVASRRLSPGTPIESCPAAWLGGRFWPAVWKVRSPGFLPPCPREVRPGPRPPRPK